MSLLESVAPYLEAALRRSGEGLTLDRVAEEVSAGRVWLIHSGHAAVALRPNGADLHVWLAGGELSEIMDMEIEVSRSAREIGFKRMTVSGGRNGWARVLKSRGWTAEGNDLVKEL